MSSSTSVLASGVEDSEGRSPIVIGDRLLKLTRGFLDTLIQVFSVSAEGDESRGVQIVYYAFPDWWLTYVEQDTRSAEERAAGDTDDTKPPVEEHDRKTAAVLVELLDEDEDAVLEGRLEGSEARELVHQLARALAALTCGEGDPPVRSLAAVHALRCQLLDPWQGKDGAGGTRRVVLSRWLVGELAKLVPDLSEAELLYSAKATVGIPYDSDSKADELLGVMLSDEDREALITALTKRLEQPAANYTSAGAVLEAVILLLQVS